MSEKLKLLWNDYSSRSTKSLIKKITECIKRDDPDKLVTFLEELKNRAIRLQLDQVFKLAIKEHRTRCLELLIEYEYMPVGPYLHRNFNNILKFESFLIYDAVAYGYDDILELFIKNGCKVNETFEKNNTALHIAAYNGFSKCIDILIRYGADPTYVNSSLYTPISISIDQRDLTSLNLMINHPFVQNYSNSERRNLLHWACLKGDLEIVKLFIEHDISADSIDIWGNTPLIDAVHLHNYELIELLSAYAKLDFPGQFKRSPLLRAAQLNDDKSLQILLEAGADVNLQDTDGNTALILAGTEKKIMETLLDFGADPNIHNTYGMTPLWFSAYYNKAESSILLIKANSKPSFPGVLSTEFQTSPFEIAYKRGHYDIVKLLIYAGCDTHKVIELINKTSALRGIHDEIIQWLIDWCKSPCSLKHISRIFIRQCIGSICFSQKVIKLCLPVSICNYIKLDDLEDVVT